MATREELRQEAVLYRRCEAGALLVGAVALTLAAVVITPDVIVEAARQGVDPGTGLIDAALIVGGLISYHASGNFGVQAISREPEIRQLPPSRL